MGFDRLEDTHYSREGRWRVLVVTAYTDGSTKFHGRRWYSWAKRPLDDCHTPILSSPQKVSAIHAYCSSSRLDIFVSTIEM